MALNEFSDFKILLTESISPSAIEEFNKWGFKKIDSIAESPEPDKLIKYAKEYNVIGIRSRTNLTKDFFNLAKNLSAIGCFCIGTNQVDLKSATLSGVPVFNSPYSNTRSVAEMAISHIISLLRNIVPRNNSLHKGLWQKSAVASYEIRGKTLGIVGYGHIGKQLGLLAESLGLNIIYYDIKTQLSLGNSKAIKSLEQLLGLSDVVSLHVPETELTHNMINSKTLKHMKKGSYLINLSRGSVVDIDAAVKAINEKHLNGAAFDVYPKEPSNKGEEFTSPLRGLENVILTPHIAGSTEEAQKNIGIEVAASLSNYLQTGSTSGAVNFVNITIPQVTDRIRFIHTHHNVPGVMAAINKLFGAMGVNIVGQFLQTDQYIGYSVTDCDLAAADKRIKIENELKTIPETIKSYSILLKSI